VYIYIFGGSCPLTEFWQVQNSLLSPSLAFSCFCSVTARHWSSGRQPNFAAWYKEWNGIVELSLLIILNRWRHLYSEGCHQGIGPHFSYHAAALCAAQQWYLSYSEADFEVFASQGRHVAPMRVQFGTDEGTLVPASLPNFTPIGATIRV